MTGQQRGLEGRPSCDKELLLSQGPGLKLKKKRSDDQSTSQLRSRRMRGLGRVGFNNLAILDEDDRVGKEEDDR